MMLKKTPVCKVKCFSVTWRSFPYSLIFLSRYSISFSACHYSPLGVSAAPEKFKAWMLQWISRARYVSPSPSTIGVLNALFLLILDEALREICKAK